MKMNKKTRIILWSIVAILGIVSAFFLLGEKAEKTPDPLIFRDSTYQEVFNTVQDGEELFVLACDSSDKGCKEAIEWAKNDLTKTKNVYFIDIFKHLEKINKAEDASSRTAATLEYYTLMENLRHVAWPLLLDIEDTKVIESWNSMADNDANSIDALTFEQIKKEVTNKYEAKK